jgi:hypothetical protein
MVRQEVIERAAGRPVGVQLNERLGYATGCRRSPGVAGVEQHASPVLQMKEALPNQHPKVSAGDPLKGE